MDSFGGYGLNPTEPASPPPPPGPPSRASVLAKLAAVFAVGAVLSFGTCSIAALSNMAGPQGHGRKAGAVIAVAGAYGFGVCVVGLIVVGIAGIVVGVIHMVRRK